MSNEIERERFEQTFPVPEGVRWNPDWCGQGRYEPENSLLNPESAEEAWRHQQRLIGWLAAHAEQPVKGNVVVMGDIQDHEGTTFQTAMVVQFPTVDDFHKARQSGQCRFTVFGGERDTHLTPCDWCGRHLPDEQLQNETEAGDAICDSCTEKEAVAQEARNTFGGPA